MYPATNYIKLNPYAGYLFFPAKKGKVLSHGPRYNGTYYYNTSFKKTDNENILLYLFNLRDQSIFDVWVGNSVMCNYCNPSILPIVIKIHWLQAPCIAGKHLVLNIFQNRNNCLLIISPPVLADIMRSATAIASVLIWVTAFSLMQVLH